MSVIWNVCWTRFLKKYSGVNGNGETDFSLLA